MISRKGQLTLGQFRTLFALIQLCYYFIIFSPFIRPRSDYLMILKFIDSFSLLYSHDFLASYIYSYFPSYKNSSHNTFVVCFLIKARSSSLRGSPMSTTSCSICLLSRVHTMWSCFLRICVYLYDCLAIEL